MKWPCSGKRGPDDARTGPEFNQERQKPNPNCPPNQLDTRFGVALDKGFNFWYNEL
jgi:hypothetical protein